MVEPASSAENQKELRRQAIVLLARREHSAKELLQKLLARGYEAGLVQPVLADLVREGLQSDDRFAESYMRFRRTKGFGPIHIQQNLQQRGVSQDAIAAVIDMQDSTWMDNLKQLRIKKFGQELPHKVKDRAKQIRFLAQRGFSQDQIGRVLVDDEII